MPLLMILIIDFDDEGDVEENLRYDDESPVHFFVF